MIKSIQQFQTEGIAKFEKTFGEYANDLTKTADLPTHSIPYTLVKK